MHPSDFQKHKNRFCFGKRVAYDTLFTFDRKLLVQANQNMKETSFLMFEEKPKSRKLNLEFKDYRININLISHDGNLNDYLNNF